MKKSIKFLTAILSIGIVTGLLFTSCKKDTDPVDKDFFLGKYVGHITYNNTEAGSEESIDVASGKINVVKVGSSYNFVFSDGIPDITNVKFKDNGSNSVISIGSDESHYIKINASELKILYNEGTETWTGNCQRD